MITVEEQIDKCCDSCCEDTEVTQFTCRVCHTKVQYCKTCLSVADKAGKCIDCYEEGK